MKTYNARLGLALLIFLAMVEIATAVGESAWFVVVMAVGSLAIVRVIDGSWKEVSHVQR